MIGQSGQYSLEQAHSRADLSGTTARTIIVADFDDLHHQHLATIMCKTCDVIALVSPLLPSSIRRRRRLPISHRRVGIVFRALTKWTGQSLEGPLTPFAPRAWSAPAAMRRAYDTVIPQAEECFRKATNHIARHHISFDTSDGLKQLMALGAEVAVFSGGPIFSREVTETIPVALNIHTGISPLYNGSFTNFWPFANGHPQLTGMTLMRMDPAIDGGPMLAHGLPSIEAGDDPATLFLKSVCLGARAASRVIERLPASAMVSVKQPRPLNYFRGRDWSLLQNLRVSMLLDEGICTNHIRPESLTEYWTCPNNEIARQTFQDFICQLVLDEPLEREQ